MKRSVPSRSSAGNVSPLAVDTQDDELIQDAMAWCAQHGLVRRSSFLSMRDEIADWYPFDGFVQVYGAGKGDGCELVHAPFALTPVPFPRSAFQRAKNASIPFNAMIDAVSQDGEYLETVLRNAAKYDKDFTVC